MLPFQNAAPTPAGNWRHIVRFGLNVASYKIAPGQALLDLAARQHPGDRTSRTIARCHRMGQVRSVDVHRLLAEHTVDQRVLEILATKAVLFDEYVRRSELKEHSPDAVDVSDLKAAEEVGSQVEAERRIIEMERKRLRMEAQ